MLSRCLSVALVLLAHAGVGGAQPASIVAKDGMTMVLVPGGEFLMGSGTPGPDEAPPHVRHLPAFYIDQTEVTCLQYQRYLDATGAESPPGWQVEGRETFPVTNITWSDAMAYAVWAGKRLPTEAEWEKVARGTDGRRYPWGEVNNSGHALTEGGQLVPVGQHPTGVSPYGALDMVGNSWEWTADWFLPYPGSDHASAFHGQKYKVVRGMGAEYLYAAVNRGDAVERARLLPYGAHDFVGFRCAMDATPDTSPYDPSVVLEEARASWSGARKDPVPLAYELAFAEMVDQGFTGLRVDGEQGRRGAVRAGVPFPQGLLANTETLTLREAAGKPVLTQNQPLTHWPDGSVRWALLDFEGEGGGEHTLHFHEATQPDDMPDILTLSKDNGYVLETGVLRARLTREGMISEIVSGYVTTGPVTFSMSAVPGHDALPRAVATAVYLRELGTWVDRRRKGEDPGPEPTEPPVLDATTLPWETLRPLPADLVQVETNGPVRATVLVRGWMAGDAGTPTPMRYDARITATRGSDRLGIQLTFTHMAARHADTEVAAPMIPVGDVRLVWGLPRKAAQARFATENEPVTLEGDAWNLHQADDLAFSVTGSDRQALSGSRAPGWVAVPCADRWAVLGVRHFWQQAPKALLTSSGTVEARLWAGDTPFEWEAGLAKTHECVLAFADTPPGTFPMDPLRPSLDPAWACGTRAIGGPMLPRGPEALALLPHYECRREAALRQWAAGMPSGFRHFGDAFMGTGTKGVHAYLNLEYDVPYNFLQEYLRTGDTWYLEQAEVQVRHQADIDTDHFTGQPWKHSPEHTRTRADMAHMFVRGMVLHHLLTGEQRSIEIARLTGDHIAESLLRNEGTGNERQIGWALYNMTGLHEATGEQQYLDAAMHLCKRLAEGQDPAGRFDIRYDNRIAFMNGIAMNGMLLVAEQTGDPAIGEAILRVADRTLGMYPEYAGRTLNAYCWALDKTGDPRYLAVLERTWEATLDNGGAVITGSYASRFPHYGAKHGLFSPVAGPGQPLPDVQTWRFQRLSGGARELSLRRNASQANIMVIIEDFASGEARLLDATGTVIGHHVFDRPDTPFQTAVFSLPVSGTVFRLLLSGGEEKAWQVHYDAAVSMVVCDPEGGIAPDLTPRGFAHTVDGADRVALVLHAEGEGYHSGELYNPRGRLAAVVRKFIAHDDASRYEMMLAAPVGDTPGVWSVRLHRSVVVKTHGLMPYWAASEGEWFDPERAMVLPVP